MQAIVKAALEPEWETRFTVSGVQVACTQRRHGCGTRDPVVLWWGLVISHDGKRHPWPVPRGRKSRDRAQGRRQSTCPRADSREEEPRVQGGGWTPDAARGARPVVRGAEGAIPSVYSPAGAVG